MTITLFQSTADVWSQDDVGILFLNMLYQPIASQNNVSQSHNRVMILSLDEGKITKS